MTVLRSGSATDVGKVRRVNQDLPLEADNLFAVADGMGGHVGGEVAAQVAVDALLQGFTREPTKVGLQDAFTKANEAVWQESQNHSELRGMGTTLTAAALVGGDDGHDTLALANVGDSRAYLFSEGLVVQVTADHSLAEERARHGELTEEEAAVHPQRHILTRALGVSAEVEADMWELQLRAGDRLVLCSDGLSNEITPEEMAEVLSTVADPGEASRQLVEIANEHGGSDNITVVVIDVLVGEENSAAGSVITPLGRGAGVPLIVAPGSGPDPSGLGPVPLVGAAGTLVEGSQLGFTGHVATLGGDTTRTGEFFPDQTQAVPVARTTVRGTASVPTVEATPPKESRRARRRRLGIPRRITLRVVLFVLLVAAIPVGAFYAIRWYAYDNWFLSIQNHEIVVQQGHPGGVLWFEPRVVDRTGVTTSEVLPNGVSEIRGGVQEPSLRDAKSYITNLQKQYEIAQQEKQVKGGSSNGTTPTIPGTTTPSSVPTSVTPTSVAQTTAAVPTGTNAGAAPATTPGVTPAVVSSTTLSSTTLSSTTPTMAAATATTSSTGP